MTSKVGVREISRNFNILQDYDYVEVEDKKSNTTKGLFVSAKYANEVKEFLDTKLKAQKQKKIDELNSFTGMLSGKIGEDKIGDIKEKYAK